MTATVRRHLTKTSEERTAIIFNAQFNFLLEEAEDT